MPPLWIIWGIIGIIFLIIEAMTAGFFIGWFGIAAIVAAVLALINMPFWFQMTAFVVCSIIGILISRKFAEKITKEPPEKAAVDRLLGQKGIVIETIDGIKGTGKIKVDRELWKAETTDGKEVEKDAFVIVKEISGTHLIVERSDEKKEN